MFYFTLGMIHNSFFFQKIQKATFTDQFYLLILFRLKTKLFSRFYQEQKMQNGLKYFARINLCVKGKLKLGEI